MLISRIDQYGKLGWLTIALIAFWLAWPIGLVLVVYLASSGRLRAWCAEMQMPGTWCNLDGFGGRSSRWTGTPNKSGNEAFDAYRTQTLNDLEDEQREFQAFLVQLRAARDKAEFDAFMEQRRGRSMREKPDNAT